MLGMALLSGAPSPSPAAESAAPSSEFLPGNEAPNGGNGAPPVSRGGGSLGDELLADIGADPGQQPEQAAEQFEFGGVKFETREKAEQNFRTLRGQHRAAQAKAQQAAQEAQQIRARLAEVEQANQRWHEWHQAQQSGQATGAAPARPGQQAAVQQAAASLLHRINPELARREFEERGPEALAQYLAYEADQHYSGVVGGLRQEVEQLRQAMAQFQPQLEPVVAEHQERQVVQQSTQAFQAAAVMADPSGQPLYPELFDEAARTDIVRIWGSFPKQFALSRGGVAAAVHAYRDYLRLSQGRGGGQQSGGEPEQRHSEGQGEAGPRQVMRQRGLTGTGVPRTQEASDDSLIARQLAGAGAGPAVGSRYKWVTRGL